MKTAWVFPGQGSQAVGMTGSLPETEGGRRRLAEAEEILGWSVLEKCQGDEAELGLTRHTQPCLYVVETILADLLKEGGQNPDYVAGHSLGEYSALYSAGVFDFETGLKLVQKRALLMEAAQGGKMAALIKFDPEQLQGLLAAYPEVVLANDNSAEQVVLSGPAEAMDQLLPQLKAKRVVPLKVSGAFHSPQMAAAAQAFEAVLTAVEFRAPQCPVLANTDPSPSGDPAVLKTRLLAQMTGGVRWREILLTLPTLGVTDLWEVGPGKVLTGLAKRTCPDLALKNIGDLPDIP
ncbi:MAG: ACP S-malonyltransferase [Cyanobacteria bacterium RI_101]|nr:ACP S-malonyltransferase [Cyanobacteria bacterium RI_101]